MPPVDRADPRSAPVSAAEPEVPDPADPPAMPAQPVVASRTFTG